MGYQLNFTWIPQYWPVLVEGIGVTLFLIVVGAGLGCLLGAACAWTRALGPGWARPIVAAYVEIIRNTPFMVQLFFIFFGLPSAGLQVSAMQAASIAMVVNLGAYSCEIMRAGIQATPRGQFEAGASLAMAPFQVFWHVVLIPALERIWPALSSQIVIVMLGSAVVSQIAAQDLSYAANYIQSRNFRAFETYIVSTIVYLLLSIAVRQVLSGVGWALFPKRKAVR